jgi:hypothetical protein
MINPEDPAIPAVENTSSEMHIDEESRPHFPPSTQTVLSLLAVANIGFLKISSKENNNPAPSINTPPQQLVKDLSTASRTPPPTSPHEHKDKTSRNANE